MSQIESYPMRNSTVIRVHYEKNLIHTSPTYQRHGDIWNLEKRQLLIDSIINDYDIPKIYLHELNEPKKLSDGRKVIYSIIDGRQRLEAIWLFLEGAFPLSDDFIFLKDLDVEAANLTYNDISKKYPKLKVFFDSFVLPIVLVKTDDLDLIEDMFSRLNEAVPLNAAEKRNAMGGPIPSIITEVSENIFFKNKVKFSNSRYQHREVSVRLLFLELTITTSNKIYDTKKIYLDNFVRIFKKDTVSNPDEFKENVTDVLSEMKKIFINKDQLLSAQASIPIYYLLFKQAIKQNLLNTITRKGLLDFREKVAENREVAERDISKADFDLLEFSRMSVQGTNDAGSIKERVRIICNYFEIEPLRI